MGPGGRRWPVARATQSRRLWKLFGITIEIKRRIFALAD